MKLRFLYGIGGRLLASLQKKLPNFFYSQYGFKKSKKKTQNI
jgi:hypothetical protein